MFLIWDLRLEGLLPCWKKGIQELGRLNAKR